MLSSSNAEPTITASATAEATVMADRATIRLGVQTQAATAAAAASQNAARSVSVMNALHKAGITDRDISTAAYDVSPQYRYAQGAAPVVVGYSVTNSIMVTLRNVRQIGPVLDASVKGGANMASSLDFQASNADSARQAAIAAAVVKARSAAQSAARAAGGTLGKLISLSIDGGMVSPPGPRPMFARVASAEMAASPPITPGEQSVSASVSATWGYSGP